MPDGKVLLDQITALSGQVNRMQSRLQHLKPLNGQDAIRLEETKQRLSAVLVRVSNDAATLAAQLEQRPPAENQWLSWRETTKQFQALAVDCLALEQSVHLRTDKYAGSLCAVADKLAEGFSHAVGQPRSHYVLVSEADHFGPYASAIHMSYGRLDIWSLNRVAHEFGHLWAEETQTGTNGAQTQFVNLLVRNSDTNVSAASPARGPALWTLGEAKEFFADIVAAFLIGPAYLSACLTLDFNPADDNRTDPHPTGHERGQCILMALTRLAKHYPGSGEQLKLLLAQLCGLWSEARIAAGKRTTIENPIELEYAVEIAVDRLVKEIPAAQYNSLAAASAVRSALEAQQKLPKRAGAVDVLNGAWLSRRMAAGAWQVPAIGVGALKMLLECCG